MMKVAMWSAFFDQQTPEEAIQLIARKGWGASELSAEHATTLLQRGDPAETGRRLARFAADHAVEIPQGHMQFVDIVGPNTAQIIDDLKRWLDLFLAIGIRAAVLHPGGKVMNRGGDLGDPQTIATRLHVLRSLCGHVRGTDVCICLENGDSAEVLLNLIKDCGCGNLGICLDTGHLHLHGGDPSHFIRTAGAHLKALHIADNDGSGDQHLMPFGRGRVPWQLVARELNAIGFAGIYNFEVPGERVCPLEVRLAKMDYLKSISPILLGTT